MCVLPSLYIFVQFTCSYFRISGSIGIQSRTLVPYTRGDFSGEWNLSKNIFLIGIFLIGELSLVFFSTAVSSFQILFVEIEFGAVFFIVSGTFFMWYNLGRR